MNSAMPARAFVKETDVEIGTVLIADDAFGCLTPGQAVAVEADENGVLFVPCSSGSHYLEGQRGHDRATKNGFVGLTLKPPPRYTVPRKRRKRHG